MRCVIGNQLVGVLLTRKQDQTGSLVSVSWWPRKEPNHLSGTKYIVYHGHWCRLKRSIFFLNYYCIFRTASWTEATAAYRVARLRCDGTVAVITDLVQVLNPLTVWIVRAAVAPHLSYNPDVWVISFFVVVLMFGLEWAKNKNFVCFFQIGKFQKICFVSLVWSPLEMMLCHIFKKSFKKVMKCARRENAFLVVCGWFCFKMEVVCM